MKRMMLVCYSGILIHTRFYGYRDLDRTHGDRLNSVGIEEFHTYAVHICHDVKDRNRMFQPVLIVPTQFSPQHCMNDTRSFEWD